MAYEDLDYFCSFAIQMLIGQIKTTERLDFVVLAFKVAHFILSPSSVFKTLYLRMYENTDIAFRFL